MRDLTVYRTEDPAVIAAYDAAQDAIAAYKQEIGETLERLGVGHLAPLGTTGHRPGRFAGLGADGACPDGWRYNTRCSCLTPDLRKAAGKAAAKALDAVRYPGDPRDALAGMPSELLVPGRWLTCGVESMGGALYVTWAADAGALGSAVDLALWQHVRLSEYYAAVERAEEAEAAGGDPA